MGGPAGAAARRVDAPVRVGLDRAPLDPTDERDAAWLRACFWPGEHERLARLDAAIAEYRAAGTEAPKVVRANVASVRRIVKEVTDQIGDDLLIAYQTLVSGYFTATDRQGYEATMRGFVETRAPGTMVWAELELHGEPDGRSEPARLRAHVAVSKGVVRTFDLARTGYHPRTLPLDADAVAGSSAALVSDGRRRPELAVAP